MSDNLVSDHNLEILDWRIDHILVLMVLAHNMNHVKVTHRIVVEEVDLVEQTMNR